MRKIIIIGAVSLPLLFLLSVYATPPISPTWTVQLHAAHGLRAGDAVEEAGRRIGQVVGVEPRTVGGGGDGTDILITLDPSSRDRLRERSTFLVTAPVASMRPVLSLVVFDEHSPALPPGSYIAGAESELELEFKRQLLVMEGAVRVLNQQLDDLRQTLDKTTRSEEKRRLEESVGGLFDSLRRTGDDLQRTLTQELDRWKRLSDKLFPRDRDRPARFVS